MSHSPKHRQIAALFVADDGPYFGVPHVDPWDAKRDARCYAGPHPVVAHPPCERWGQYATGGPNPRARRRLVGDDGGCFAAALTSVRAYGGVIEHPRGSKAFAFHGLNSPTSAGGWDRAVDGEDEWPCCVAQGHYGHVAQKMTWLFVSGIPYHALPQLIWGKTTPHKRLDPGYHSLAEAKADRARSDYVPMPRLSASERIHTPLRFRDLLISIAASAAPIPILTKA